MRTYQIILISTLLCAPQARAHTYHVYPNGSGDYPTIQAAIDACTDGDEVVLGNGAFKGSGNKNLQIPGKVITVRSEWEASGCVIDCQGSGRGFVLSGGFVAATIEGYSRSAPATPLAFRPGTEVAFTSPRATSICRGVDSITTPRPSWAVGCSWEAASPISMSA